MGLPWPAWSDESLWRAIFGGSWHCAKHPASCWQSSRSKEAGKLKEFQYALNAGHTFFCRSPCGWLKGDDRNIQTAVSRLLQSYWYAGDRWVVRPQTTFLQESLEQSSNIFMWLGDLYNSNNCPLPYKLEDSKSNTCHWAATPVVGWWSLWSWKWFISSCTWSCRRNFKFGSSQFLASPKRSISL